MSSDEESDIETEKTAADDAVVGKYSMAGEFTNGKLQESVLNQMCARANHINTCA